MIKRWKKLDKNDGGFILYSFGGSGPKVWSEEEALEQRGRGTKTTHRVFPCYSDLSNVNSLKWYVFYKND